MFATRRLRGGPVGKRARVRRDNDGCREALSPRPRVSLLFGESSSLVMEAFPAVSHVWTSVYVARIVSRVAATFTTGTLALLKGLRSGKPWGSRELRLDRSRNVANQVVKVKRKKRIPFAPLPLCTSAPFLPSLVEGCSTNPCFFDFGTFERSTGGSEICVSDGLFTV